MSYALLERLERELGDPLAAGGSFSLERCLALDEREEFPTEICALLDAQGIPGYYVPAALGGLAVTFEDTLQAVRALARRDLTVAVAHAKTFLGAVTAWVGAAPEQARRLAGEVLAGRVVSWALTERAHGSDLLAGEVVAQRAGGGYRVSGEKWLINNATRADLVCVLARTDPAGGPRGYSLLLVDKRAVAPGGYRCLPAERTHGVRGADISGIAFHDAEVPAGALVGAEGAGLELTLKGFQVSRTLCTGLSLGAADRGLRLALRFATGHHLYGRPLAELPQARRVLAEAYADLLLAEVASTVAMRGVHALPGEAAVSSAAVKYLVPTTVDGLLSRLGQLLGARAFLRALPGPGAGGSFQKLERDHRIVGIFDGSTMVNLDSLVGQFPLLVRCWRGGPVHPAAVRAAAGTGPLPPFAPERLGVVARDGCAVVQSLPAAILELAAREPGLAGTAHRLGLELEALHRAMEGCRTPARRAGPEAFDLAKRYARAYAAAACVWYYLSNQDSPARVPGLWQDALWLRACLSRLLPDVDGGDAALDALGPHLLAGYATGALFAPLRCRLTEVPR
ncbi:MAG TPA: acyl-CoA dehydrogenase family protein [Rugosimonospora sp.]|nr:acyl-CoA dehydrogenase family protein [Rugosimonospora sp.]